MSTPLAVYIQEGIKFIQTSVQKHLDLHRGGDGDGDDDNQVDDNRNGGGTGGAVGAAGNGQTGGGSGGGGGYEYDEDTQVGGGMIAVNQRNSPGRDRGQRRGRGRDTRGVAEFILHSMATSLSGGRKKGGRQERVVYRGRG